MAVRQQPKQAPLNPIPISLCFTTYPTKIHVSYAKEASTGEEAGSSIDVLLVICVSPAYFYFFHFWKKQNGCCLPPNQFLKNDINTHLIQCHLKYILLIQVFTSSKAVCGLDCGLHGQCLGDSCVCSPGWQGSRCTLKACSERCKGQCINGTCICQKGFNGQFCGINACGPNCHSHGLCENVADEHQRPIYE